MEADAEARNEVALQAGLGMHPSERALAVRISSVLFGMVALVLVVTCANLAALLLARGTAREGEIGLRLAVGAARARVIRQLLLETALIATLGSVLAFVSTRWTARFIEALMPYDLAVRIAPNGRVLVFGTLIGVATAVAFAIVPAFRARASTCSRCCARPRPA